MKEENGTTTIPILGPEDLDEKGEPTEYAMIELNGELLSPTEIPTTEKVQEILGGTDRVELGRLKLGPNDTVRCTTTQFMTAERPPFDSPLVLSSRLLS